MEGMVKNGNTFIYYSDMSNIFGVKCPKYEKNRVISAYTGDDERAKRYKYFLYEEVP